MTMQNREHTSGTTPVRPAGRIAGAARIDGTSRMAGASRMARRRGLGIALAALLVAGPAAGTLLAQTTPEDSLTVERAVAIALERSPAVRGAREAISAAEARTGQVKSNYYPQVEADAAFRRIDPTISVDFPIDGKLQTFSFAPNNNYEAAVSLHQTLYDFGRSAAQMDVARFAEQSAADNVDLVRSSIAYQVIGTYYSLLLLDRSLSVQDEQIAALRASLEVSRKRESEGSATSFDVLSTQVRLTTLENGRTDIVRDVTKQEAQMRRLLGLAPNAPIRLKGEFNPVQRSEAAADLVALALKNRAELVNARDAVHAAELQMAVARTGETPTIGLTLSGGVKNGFPPDLEKLYPNWVGGVQVAVPIFNGFRSRYKEEEAEANLRAAQDRLADLEAGVGSEVTQAAADLEATYGKIAAAGTQIEQAREALRLAQLRYANGAITSTELLNAQAVVQETELLRIQALYGNIVSRYALDRATGIRPY